MNVWLNFFNSCESSISEKKIFSALHDINGPRLLFEAHNIRCKFLKSVEHNLFHMRHIYIDFFFSFRTVACGIDFVPSEKNHSAHCDYKAVETNKVNAME